MRKRRNFRFSQSPRAKDLPAQRAAHFCGGSCKPISASVIPVLGRVLVRRKGTRLLWHWRGYGDGRRGRVPHGRDNALLLHSRPIFLC